MVIVFVKEGREYIVIWTSASTIANVMMHANRSNSQLSEIWSKFKRKHQRDCFAVFSLQIVRGSKPLSSGRRLYMRGMAREMSHLGLGWPCTKSLVSVQSLPLMRKACTLVTSKRNSMINAWCAFLSGIGSATPLALLIKQQSLDAYSGKMERLGRNQTWALSYFFLGMAMRRRGINWNPRLNEHSCEGDGLCELPRLNSLWWSSGQAEPW